MSIHINSPLTMAILVSMLTACGNNSEDVSEQTGSDTSDSNTPSSETVTGTAPEADGNWTESDDLQATGNPVDADLPYPVYPNGTQYRTGGENGLTIVLFQTEDTFAEVDAYYSESSDMARLSAMNDYVRYSVSGEDDDPWATDQPGIVIHQFNDESEREAVGANENARTNIIMSY